MPIITLTTDFGITDSYVGQVKGVILGIAPDAKIVDISHNIPAQNIAVGGAGIGFGDRRVPRRDDSRCGGRPGCGQ